MVADRRKRQRPGSRRTSIGRWSAPGKTSLTSAVAWGPKRSLISALSACAFLGSDPEEDLSGFSASEHYEKAKEALLAEGVSKDRIRVIPMGIDLNRFKPEAKDLPV